ncbi:MAG: universal stress protein [Natrialbaceae archaeon]|nr:universal stress protein [Natrialbaceae archaeon]
MAPSRLLVPVANPETADRLMDTAADIALDRDLGVLVLTVVEVPRQLPLSAAREQLDTSQSERVLEHAVDRAVERGVGVTGQIRFGRDVARSICTVAASESIEALLLGWRQRPVDGISFWEVTSTRLLTTAPSDVIVKRIDRESAAIESVLVPIAGGPNTEYAAGIAGSIARARNADVELLSIVDSESALSTGRELLETSTPAVGPVRSVTETVLVRPGREHDSPPIWSARSDHSRGRW